MRYFGNALCPILIMPRLRNNLENTDTKGSRVCDSLPLACSHHGHLIKYLPFRTVLC